MTRDEMYSTLCTILGRRPYWVWTYRRLEAMLVIEFVEPISVKDLEEKRRHLEYALPCYIYVNILQPPNL